jgi:hypothetical protein
VMGAAPGLTTPAMAAITDIDIANFALNLEYFEAEFYLHAAFGTGLPHNEVTGTGTLGLVSGGRRVPFKDPRIAAYAQEIANDEHSHVKFFRAVTGAARVARPALNLDTSFTMAARAAGIIGSRRALFDGLSSTYQRRAAAATAGIFASLPIAPPISRAIRKRLFRQRKWATRFSPSCRRRIEGSLAVAMSGSPPRIMTGRI